MECKSVSEAVSRRILQLCRDKNITVNKLATLSAVTQSTVNDIINMKSKNIGIVTLKKLCDGLQITITDFSMTICSEILNRKYTDNKSKPLTHITTSTACFIIILFTVLTKHRLNLERLAVSDHLPQKLCCRQTDLRRVD